LPPTLTRFLASACTWRSVVSGLQAISRATLTLVEVARVVVVEDRRTVTAAQIAVAFRRTVGAVVVVTSHLAVEGATRLLAVEGVRLRLRPKEASLAKAKYKPTTPIGTT